MPATPLSRLEFLVTSSKHAPPFYFAPPSDSHRRVHRVTAVLDVSSPRLISDNARLAMRLPRPFSPWEVPDARFKITVVTRTRTRIDISRRLRDPCKMFVPDALDNNHRQKSFLCSRHADNRIRYNNSSHFEFYHATSTQLRRLVSTSWDPRWVPCARLFQHGAIIYTRLDEYRRSRNGSLYSRQTARSRRQRAYRTNSSLVPRSPITLAELIFHLRRKTCSASSLPIESKSDAVRASLGFSLKCQTRREEQRAQRCPRSRSITHVASATTSTCRSPWTVSEIK